MLVVCALLIVAVTYPWGDMVGPSHWTRVRWIPFKTGPIRLLDVAGNLLLCAPLGAAAGYLFSGRSRGHPPFAGDFGRGRGVAGVQPQALPFRNRRAL